MDFTNTVKARLEANQVRLTELNNIEKPTERDLKEREALPRLIRDDQLRLDAASIVVQELTSGGVQISAAPSDEMKRAVACQKLAETQEDIAKAEIERSLSDDPETLPDPAAFTARAEKLVQTIEAIDADGLDGKGSDEDKGLNVT